MKKRQYTKKSSLSYLRGERTIEDKTRDDSFIYIAKRIVNYYENNNNALRGGIKNG